jgi:hypothetical protein
VTLSPEQIAAGWLPHDGGHKPKDLHCGVTTLTRGGDVAHWTNPNAPVWRHGTPIAEIAYQTLPRGAEIIAYLPDLPEPPQ